METLLSKILNYEECIFNEFILKRKNLIENITKIDFLNKNQLFIFINDLKAIIDPIKTSTVAIDHYFTNTSFENNESVLEQEQLNKLLSFYFLFGLFSTEALETEIPESISESVSELLVSESDDSLSDPKSSRSVSVTFSNKNCFE